MSERGLSDAELQEMIREADTNKDGARPAAAEAAAAGASGGGG
jgi:hypothetical protein